MLKNIKIYSINSIFLSFLSLLSISILTKYLDLYNFGLIALSILIGNIVSGFLSLGLPQATVRFYYESLSNSPGDISKEDFKKLNFINLFFIFFVHLISLFLLILFLDQIVFLINVPDINNELILFSFILGYSNKFYAYFINLLIAQKKAKKYSYLTILFSVILIVITFLLLFFYNANYLSRVYSLLFCYLSFSIIFLILFRKTFKISFDIKYLIKSLNYCFPSIPEIIIGLVNDNFDKSIIVKIKNIGTLGIYDISLRLSSFFKNLIDVVLKVYVPEFMSLAGKGDKKQIKSMYNCVAFYISVSCLVVSYFSEEILFIFTSKSFYVAKYYIPLICISILTNHLFSFITRNQNMYAKKLLNNIPGSIIYLVINISLNIYAINSFGIYGACAVLIISGIISSIVNLYLSNKVFYLSIKLLNIIMKIIYISLFILPLYVIFYFEVDYFVGLIIKIILLFLFLTLFFKKEYLNQSTLNNLTK